MPPIAIENEQNQTITNSYKVGGGGQLVLPQHISSGLLGPVAYSKSSLCHMARISQTN